MATQEHHAPELERALLRRGVDERSDEFERCTRCHRTPLIGERIYQYEGGKLACECDFVLVMPEDNELPLQSWEFRVMLFFELIQLFDVTDDLIKIASDPVNLVGLRAGAIY